MFILCLHLAQYLNEALSPAAPHIILAALVLIALLLNC